MKFSQRILTALIASACLCMTAPASGSYEPVRTPAADTTTPHWKEVLWSAAQRTHELSSLARAQGEIMEAMWGEDYPLALAMTAGDVTGDGLEDVITGPPQSFGDTLDVRRGTDGRPMWRIRKLNTGRFFSLPVPVGDLTGDGSADILTLNLSDEELDCDKAVACVADQDGHRWDVELLSGADGSVVWRRIYTGRTTRKHVPGLGYSSVEWQTNAFIAPFVTDDLDGDGLPDVVVNVVDAVRAVTDTNLSIDSTIGRTQATLVNGRDGRAVFSRSSRRFDSRALLLPAGNTVGNDTPDLLWEAGTRADAGATVTTYSLEMVDGATREGTWKTRRPPLLGSAFVESPGRDLTGDGRPDLILREFRWDPVTFQSSATFAVVRSADGAVLWSRPATGAVHVIGPVGGNSGDDILLMEPALDDEFQPAGVRLVRLDGLEGFRLFVTAQPSSHGADFVADVDGDHVSDIASTRVSSSSRELLVESGRTGEPVFARPLHTSERVALAGDHDGRPGAELMLVRHRHDLEPDEIELTLVSAVDDAVLWTRTDIFEAAQGQVDVAPIEDASGDGRDDLVYLRRTDNSSPWSGLGRIDLLGGASGAALWSAGDDF